MAWERWRRVPEPNACDFCLTLASRGAVYHTKITAAGKRYHRMCRCTAAVEGKFSARKDTAIPEEDANRIVKMQVTKKGKTYVYVYDLSKFPRLKPPPKVKTPAPVSNGVKAATPQPVTTGSFADRIAALRAKYRRDDDWLETVPLTDMEKADLLAKRDELKALLTPREDILAGWKASNPTGWRKIPVADDLEAYIVSLRSQIAEIDDALKRGVKPGGGPTDAAMGNLDVVLRAGDDVLNEVERVMDKTPVVKAKERLEAAIDATTAARVARDQADDIRHALERLMNERMVGQRLTAQEFLDRSQTEIDAMLRANGKTFDDWLDEKDILDSAHIRRVRETRAAYSDAIDAQIEARRLVTQAEGEVWRDAIVKVFGETRAIGGQGSKIVNPKTGKPLTSRSAVGRVLQEASQVYPTEWLEAQAKRFPTLTAGEVKRGYFNSRTGEIRVSGDLGRSAPTDPKGMFPTAVHELGHSMEYSIPDIGRLEWLWLRQRAKFDTPTPESRVLLYKTKFGEERAYEDDFTSRYTGKTYERVYADLAGPESAYEVFTTGVQALFGGEIDDYMMRKGKSGFDRDFARFILGVMVVV